MAGGESDQRRHESPWVRPGGAWPRSIPHRGAGDCRRERRAMARDCRRYDRQPSVQQNSAGAASAARYQWLGLAGGTPALVWAIIRSRHRRRSMSPPAAFPDATQAEAHLPLRATPGLTVIIAAVQLATAKRAALPASVLGQIAIDFLQQLIYLLIRQMVLAPAFSDTIFQHLRSERKNPRRTSSPRGFQLSGVSVQENQWSPPIQHHQLSKIIPRETQLSS